MIDRMGQRLSESLGSTITQALAPLAPATQSVAPVGVRSIPITQEEENVVPSGDLFDITPSAPVIPSHNVADSSDSDSDSDSGNRKPSERKTKRKRWAEKLYDYLPDVARPVVPTPDDSNVWWGTSTSSPCIRVLRLC